MPFERKRHPISQDLIAHLNCPLSDPVEGGIDRFEPGREKEIRHDARLVHEIYPEVLRAIAIEVENP